MVDYSSQTWLTNVVAVVNIYQARTQFSQLVDRASQGEEIIIAKAGVCVARLCPMETPSARRKPGGWEGQVAMSEDFNEPLPDGFWTDGLP